MNLFEELQKLEETISLANEIATDCQDTNTSSDFSLMSKWLQELFEIKKARLALEVMGNPKLANFLQELENNQSLSPLIPFLSPFQEVFGICSECNREVLKCEDIPASHDIPGVTNGVVCICRQCWDKNPEKYEKQYLKLKHQFEGGEFDSFDSDLQITCSRCGGDSLTDNGDFLQCGKCGLRTVIDK
jgi:ribosomal protein S27AE